MQTLADLIQTKAIEADCNSAMELHAKLTAPESEGGAGLTVTSMSVYDWWAGRARPEKFATQLCAFLKFTDAERLLLHELPLVPRGKSEAAA